MPPYRSPRLKNRSSLSVAIAMDCLGEPAPDNVKLLSILCYLSLDGREAVLPSTPSPPMSAKFHPRSAHFCRSLSLAARL